MQPFIQNILQSKGENTLSAWDNYNEAKKSLPDYTDVTNPVDELGYIGKKIKDIGLSEADVQSLNLKKQAYFNQVDSQLSLYVAKQRWNMVLEKGEQKISLLTQEILQGVSDLDTAISKMTEFYESTGKAPALS